MRARTINSFRCCRHKLFFNLFLLYCIIFSYSIDVLMSQERTNKRISFNQTTNFMLHTQRIDCARYRYTSSFLYSFLPFRFCCSYFHSLREPAVTVTLASHNQTTCKLIQLKIEWIGCILFVINHTSYLYHACYFCLEEQHWAQRNEIHRFIANNSLGPNWTHTHTVFTV